MRFSDIGKSFGAQAICPEREFAELYNNNILKDDIARKLGQSEIFKIS